MSVRVLYFARSRELVGRSEEEVRLDTIEKTDVATSAAGSVATEAAPPAPAAAAAVSVKRLLQHLVTLHPALSSLLGCSLLALNHEFVAMDSDTPLSDGDEVAFIQPISGG